MQDGWQVLQYGYPFALLAITEKSRLIVPATVATMATVMGGPGPIVTTVTATTQRSSSGVKIIVATVAIVARVGGNTQATSTTIK